MSETQQTSRLKRVILLALATAVMLCFGVWISWFFRSANLNGEESGQRQLLADVQRELEIYHINHGTYPRQLSDIRITTFRGGATPAMLQQFRYDSDSTTYALHCFGAATRKMITVQPLNK